MVVMMQSWNKLGRGPSKTMMTMSAEDSLEAKYMADDASSKKFLLSYFTNFKMADSRPVFKEYNELLDFKHTLKHLKEELTLVKLGSHMHIEESLGMQDSDKPKGNNVAGPSVVNMVEHNNSSRTYPTPVLTQKVFNKMKRVTRGYSGEDIPLFPSIITAPDTSLSRITSSPSLSPQHTPVIAPSPLPPPITETTPTAEEPAPIPHESPLQSVQSLGRDEGSVSINELIDLVTQLTNKVGSLENELKNTKKVYGTAITKLAKRVKKLEKQVKTCKASIRTKIVLLEDEDIEEDSSKQGRSLIEELDMDADISLVPPHAEIQEKISDETEGEQEVCTTNIPISTASETHEVSTAAESLVYIRRSEKKKKDKGKAIMIKDESVQKKSKKQEQEERLGHKESIRLQEQIDEEERKRIEKVWDQIHSFVFMDSEEEVPRLKRAGQDVEAKPAKRQRTEEVSESVQEQTNEEPKTNELSQE
ncbi:hypothetical protein Tco_1085752 [Tanacetum coccineum]